MAFLDFFLQPLREFPAVTLLLFGIAVRRCWTFVQSRKLKPLYPPGPVEKNFITGNLGDLPSEKGWIAYNRLSANLQSAIIHFRVFGQHIVILDTLKVCQDLLEKRSKIYSSRPHSPMLELTDFNWATGQRQYGAAWRVHRQLLQQGLRTNLAMTQYRPAQNDKINYFLHSLLVNPDEFRYHYKSLSAAIIMRVIYGYDTAPNKDHFLHLAEDAMGKFAESISTPGAAMVNSFPSLRHIPQWLMWPALKKFTTEGRRMTKEIREVPFAFVKDNLDSGRAHVSMVSELILKDHDREMIKEVAATGYVAGADSTMSVIGTFFYAMTIYPQVQKKAQQEVDRIVGTHRLPTFDNQGSLPYINALLKEVLRWKPVTPLGLPHATSEDDIYNGYSIPKDTVVLANIWAIAYNSEIYEKPEIFNPDRYFDENGKPVPGIHADEWSFGFGRRICPGRKIAIDTAWLAIARILSTFNIERKKDASGKEIPVNENLEYEDDGLVCHPAPFICAIVPRSDEAKRLIKEANGNH